MCHRARCRLHLHRESPMTRLLLATNNPGKLHELVPLLSDVPLHIVTPHALGLHLDVEETGTTYAENARLKAVAFAHASGLLTLADDSGLEVEALGGAPGVRSARWAGEPAVDARNNAKLLRELAGVPDERRGARFVCALALARPDGTLALEVSGEARGRILDAPRGDGDFGYDPLFLFTEPGFAQTGMGFAELTNTEKSAVSHRGRALRALAEGLAALVEDERSHAG